MDRSVKLWRVGLKVTRVVAERGRRSARGVGRDDSTITDMANSHCSQPAGLRTSPLLSNWEPQSLDACPPPTPLLRCRAIFVIFLESFLLESTASMRLLRLFFVCVTLCVDWFYTHSAAGAADLACECAREYDVLAGPAGAYFKKHLKKIWDRL